MRERFLARPYMRGIWILGTKPMFVPVHTHLTHDSSRRGHGRQRSTQGLGKSNNFFHLPYVCTPGGQLSIHFIARSLVAMIFFDYALAHVCAFAKHVLPVFACPSITGLHGGRVCLSFVYRAVVSSWSCIQNAACRLLVYVSDMLAWVLMMTQRMDLSTLLLFCSHTLSLCCE